MYTIVIPRVLLYTRVEVPGMQILRVERVRAVSTDGRKSLTSLIRRSIIWSVFCTVEMYNAFIEKNRPDASPTAFITK